MKTVTNTIAFLTILTATLSANAQNLNLKNNEVNIEIAMEEGELQISWSTQKEVNSSYFLVEKSNDSLHFTSVKMIPAAGNSNFPRNYQYTEAENNNAKVYYRVTLVTMNGQQLASVPVPVSVINTANLAAK